LTEQKGGLAEDNETLKTDLQKATKTTKSGILFHVPNGILPTKKSSFASLSSVQTALLFGQLLRLNAGIEIQRETLKTDFTEGNKDNKSGILFHVPNGILPTKKSSFASLSSVQTALLFGQLLS